MTRRIMYSALAVISVAVACVGVGFTAVRAAAVFEELPETGRHGYLTLALDSTTPAWKNLAPGQSMRWLVQSSLHDAPLSTLAVELRAGGDLVDSSGMTVEVEACSGAFELSTDPSVTSPCLGDRSTVLPSTPLAEFRQGGQPGNAPSGSRSGELFELTDLRRDAPQQLLVTMTIPATTTDAAIAGQQAQIGLGFHASGTDADTGHAPPRLAVTGADGLALALLAAGLLGIGLVALLRVRAGDSR